MNTCTNMIRFRCFSKKTLVLWTKVAYALEGSYLTLINTLSVSTLERSADLTLLYAIGILNIP